MLLHRRHSANVFFFNLEVVVCTFGDALKVLKVLHVRQLLLISEGAFRAGRD